MRPREDRQQRGSALLQACPAASTVYRMSSPARRPWLAGGVDRLDNAPM